MTIPSWPFAWIRFGIIGLIYMKFAPGFALLEPLSFLYYGLPFMMLFAVLGLHRFWFFALGSLLLATSLTDLLPQVFRPLSFHTLALGLVTFALGFTPCDRDYSIRSLWNERLAPPLAGDGWWNVYRIVAGAIFAHAALRKSYAGFFSGNEIMVGLFDQFGPLEILYQSWIPALAVLIAGLLWALNMALAVLVWQPRLYLHLVVVGLAYNTLYLIVGQNRFYPALFTLLLLPFLGASQRGAKVSKLSTSPY